MTKNSQTPANHTTHANKGKIISFLTALLAVIASIVLWFFAIDYDSPDYTKTFSNIKVEVTGLAELRQTMGYTLLEEPDLTVDVTIAGKRTDVNQVRSSEITASIDLSTVAAAGENKFEVQITAPDGTTVASQSIREVRLYVDNFISAQYTVKVRNMNYTLAENLYIDTVVCSPATVTVWGPENELAKISGAYVDLEMGELVNSIKVTSTAKLLDINNAEVDNPYIYISNSSVTSSVSVYMEKEVPVRVKLTGGVYSELTADIRCDMESVLLRGTVERMTNIKEYVIEIDETDTQFDSPIKVLITPPNGVVNADEQQYATVLLSIPDIGKREMVISSKAVEFLNLPDGIDAKALADITVELRGLQDILDTLTEDDISVTVDMSVLGELSEGTAIVPVTVSISNEDVSGVFVYNKNAYTVQIITK